MDENIFGHFEIAKLFVTGNFLPIKQYSDIYDYVILTEFEKELKLLISKYTYKTKYDLDIKTCSNKHPQSKNLNVWMQHTKPFCFDRFSKGELRTVASRTYLGCKDFYSRRYNLHQTCFEKEDGKTTMAILARGEELSDAVIKVQLSKILKLIFLCKIIIYVQKGSFLFLLS